MNTAMRLCGNGLYATEPEMFQYMENQWYSWDFQAFTKSLPMSLVVPVGHMFSFYTIVKKETMTWVFQ